MKGNEVKQRNDVTQYWKGYICKNEEVFKKGLQLKQISDAQEFISCSNLWT
jgi:hypothetical protein